MNNKLSFLTIIILTLLVIIPFSKVSADEIIYVDDDFNKYNYDRHYDYYPVPHYPDYKYKRLDEYNRSIDRFNRAIERFNKATKSFKQSNQVNDAYHNYYVESYPMVEKYQKLKQPKWIIEKTDKRKIVHYQPAKYVKIINTDYYGHDLGIININNLNFRSGPSKNHKIIGGFKKNAEVIVLNRVVNNGYVEVLDPVTAKKGWIYRKYMTPVKTLEYNHVYRNCPYCE